MADYTEPFHMPKFSDAEFLEKKAAYVREHGYTITFPQVSDIIHLGITKPMTPEEKILWYSGKRKEIPQKRQIELYALKERSRENFRRFKASPVPNWATSYVSILTAMDDAQDAIITLAAIGRIAIKFLPKFLSRFLAGPIGWIWLLAELMSILMAPTACALNPLGCKRAMKKKLMRRVKGLKAGVKGYARSGGFLPSFAEGIQVAQVTDNIFGVGLSIGPIFGLWYDLISGGVRWARGEKVSFARSPSDVEIFRKAADRMHNYARWKRPARKMTRGEFLMWKEDKIRAGTWGAGSQQDDMVQKAMRLHQTYGGVLRRTDWLQETLFYCGAELAGQGVKTVLDHWNPMENVEGLEHIEIEAYNEPNPLIEEMLLEEGVDPEKGIAWPSLGKRWATYEEIQTSTAEVAGGNFEHFVAECPDERLKIIAENSAIEGGLHNIAMLEGRSRILIEYNAGINIIETLLDKGYSFPRSVTEDQIYEFGYWTQEHEANRSRPTLRETLDYAKNSLGFEFTTHP